MTEGLPDGLFPTSIEKIGQRQFCSSAIMVEVIDEWRLIRKVVPAHIDDRGA